MIHILVVSSGLSLLAAAMPDSCSLRLTHIGEADKPFPTLIIRDGTKSLHVDDSRFLVVRVPSGTCCGFAFRFISSLAKKPLSAAHEAFEARWSRRKKNWLRYSTRDDLRGF